MWLRRSQARTEQPQKSAHNSLLQVDQTALVIWNDRRIACRLHSIDTRTLKLATLLDAQAPDSLPEAGAHVEVSVGVSSGFINFHSRVVAITKEDSLSIIECTLPPEAIRTNRRQYYRVPVELPIHVKIGAEGEPIIGQMIDLSGGGALTMLPVTAPVYPGRELELKFQLPGEDLTVVVPARVRSVASEVTGAWRKVACQFTADDEHLRDSIIRYVARRQLELIRAGQMH